MLLRLSKISSGKLVVGISIHLIFRDALIDLRDEKVVAFGVVVALLILGQEVEVLADQLGELLVHLPLGLRLHLCESV